MTAADGQGVVLITGTPGVGKHTTGRLLSEETGWPVIDVNQSARMAGLCGLNAACHDGGGSGGGGSGGGGGTSNARGIEVDVGELSEVIRLRLADQGSCIIVGHLAPYVTPPERTTLAAILRRNPRDLARVYRERGYAPSKARDNTGAEVLGTIAYDVFATFGKKAVQFDTTDREPAHTAARILDAVSSRLGGGGRGTPAVRPAVTGPGRGQTAATGDVVDWLGAAADGGALDELFGK